MAAVSRRRIVFTGTVQGVGFRATARALARARPLTGWVRNEPDGTVLLEVQGDPADVEAYLAEVQARMGRLIRGIDVVAAPPAADESTFEIRR